MKEYDVIIIGAGMAGMSAATYAALDGFKIALIEQAGHAGGQAYHSPLIENVAALGAISGSDLANRSLAAAEKAGVDYIEDTVEVVSYHNDLQTHVATQKTGFTLRAPMILLATGSHFRKLVGERFVPFEDKSLFYGQAPYVSEDFKDEPVAVVGGGNAAAQSVIYLAGLAERVLVVARSAPTWSRYLDKTIRTLRNVEVLENYQVVDVIARASWGGWMERIVVEGRSGIEDEYDCSALFVLAGQVPNIKLAQGLGLRLNSDNEKRIRVGDERWPDEVQRTGIMREPLALETSRPGIFAAGDVRDGMGHGIGAAIGDGNVAASCFWQYYAAHDPARFQALLTGGQPALPGLSHSSLASNGTPTR